MKPHRTWFFCILPFLWLASVSVLAQATISDDEVELRALKPNWTAKNVDGIQIKIHKALHPKNEDSKFRLVDPQQVFNSGDRIRFEFESNFTGYLYLINIAPSGEKEVIFPRAGLSNKVIAFRSYHFPSEEADFKDFIFDKEPGIEIVQVLLTRERILVLDNAVNERDGKLTALPKKVVPPTVAQAGMVADEVKIEAGDFEARGVLIAKESNGATIVAVKRRPISKPKAVPQKTSGSTTREHKMTIVRKTDTSPLPPPEKTEMVNVTTTPDVIEKAAGQLSDKEVLVFEMRLKHQ